MKPTGKQVVQAANLALEKGYSYAEMDCQAFVEHCVTQAGGTMDYRGSNHMVRNVAWLGTIENAKAEGKLIPGCLLFIHEEGEANLPACYQGDGLGDFSHVGLYLGSGFTSEVAHSSASRGGVFPSTLKNGWTHVGLAKEIDYGASAEALEGLTLGANIEKELIVGTSPAEALPRYGVVDSGNGRPVKLRKSASAKEPIYWKVNHGARVEMLRRKGDWWLIRALCTDGHIRRAYMMGKYLTLEEEKANG